MREHPGGKPYIGPKVQAHVPPEDWEVIDHIKREGGLSASDALRAVVAEGAAILRQRNKIGAR